MKTRVAVIIPNLNGQDFITECLVSLKNQTIKPKIIVVENGSEDNSIEVIERIEGIELIKLLKNLGFAGGVNVGIKKAMKDGYEFVALFNNDAVADKNWLENLLMAADNHKVAGIITGKLMLDDKRHIDSTGDFYSIWGLPFPRGRNEIDNGQYDKTEYIFGASGGATLYRTKLFNEIGLFDEDFFAYFEDVDISFRAQLAGWLVVYESTAVAFHKLSLTSSKMGTLARYNSAKNFLILYSKNMPIKLYYKYLLLFILQFFRMMLGSMVHGHFWTFIKGTVASLKLHPKTVKKRQIIQKSRKVPIYYIDSTLYHHRPPKPPKII